MQGQGALQGACIFSVNPALETNMSKCHKCTVTSQAVYGND